MCIRDSLLDAGGVNAAVGDEVLEGNTGGLTTDRVEARKNDGLGRVVNHLSLIHIFISNNTAVRRQID